MDNKKREALLAELTKLRKRQETLKQLITTSGFINYYMSQLHLFKTQKETYYYVNDLYEEITGVSKYGSYESFKVIKTKFFKTNKNV